MIDPVLRAPFVGFHAAALLALSGGLATLVLAKAVGASGGPCTHWPFRCPEFCASRRATTEILIFITAATLPLPDSESKGAMAKFSINQQCLRHWD
jgi:hypothetical protein